MHITKLHIILCEENHSEKLLRMSEIVHICTTLVLRFIKFIQGGNPGKCIEKSVFIESGTRQIITRLFAGKFVGNYINDNPV